MVVLRGGIGIIIESVSCYSNREGCVDGRHRGCVTCCRLRGGEIARAEGAQQRDHLAGVQPSDADAAKIHVRPT